MWDFLQYTSGEKAFSFSQDVLKTIGAGVRVGAEVRSEALASRTVLKILCKSSLEYLGILVVATATGSFILGGLTG